MSGLFGGAQKATTHATRAMGIDFQGAQYGAVVPVGYGRNRVPGNCVWYGDFQSHAQQQQAGKGGGGGNGGTSYTYSASAQMGLCEGPGIGLVTVYDGTSVVNLSSINYTFASGAMGQAPWSHLSGNAALGYSLTAIFSFQNLDLGSQASLPNHNYELDMLKPFSASIRDANPRDILSDICSDPYHGVNFPFLGDLTQYSNYCVANSLFLSPVYDQQQSANQALSDLFKYTNTYVYYSEDKLKVVPLGDTAVSGNGVTFTPNVTPVVNLGTDDFLADGTGSTITVERKAPQDNLNLVRVEFKDRSNTYHDSAVVAAIDEDIITNGGRSDDSETVNGCTSASVARFIGQNLVQRAFYVRDTYQFKLTWRYCYLEPTDIVTLTDAALGLSLYPVRITEIEEDGDSALTITAEEFPEGIGHSAIYDTQPNGGTNIDQNADPGAVNAPFLFRGPGFLVGNNTPEIWCAVNGSEPMWAACEVYLSHDGNSYTYCGTIAGQARYGALTSALAAGTAEPDTTNTPTVQVYAPAQLLGGSQTDADNFVTLAMVDTEVFAYETATLQAANTYQLGYLRRGGYGSGNVAHASGAPFVRLDESIFRIPVDPSLIGSTVYLKFLSLNVFGRTPRTLAEETAYTYVVGTNVELPDVPDAPTGFAVTPVADGVEITWSNDNPAATGCTSIEYTMISGGPFTVLAQVGPTTTAYHHGFTNGATYYYRARARGPLVQSGWSAYTAVVSSTGKTVYATGGGKNALPNGSFATNTVGTPVGVSLASNSPVSNGWETGVIQSGQVCIYEAGSTGTDVLIRSLGGTSVPANDNITSNFVSGIYSCIPGTPFVFNVIRGVASNVALPAGVTCKLRTYIAWLKGDKSLSATTVLDANGNSNAGALATLTGLVPTDAVSFYVNCQAILANSNATPTTVGSAGQLPADMRWYSIQVIFGASDQRELLPVTWAGVRSVLSISPISFSISGTTVTFSVAAFTLQGGGISISYAASSGSVTQTAGTTMVYYLYYRDATASGGSLPLFISTSPQSLAAFPDIVMLGTASVTVASGGGGTGGTGSGGGGYCVADDMFIGEGRRAGDAQIGDLFDCIDLPAHAGRHQRALQGLSRGTEECVRLITDDGCALTCSESTPFDTPDGRTLLAPEMLGEKVVTDLHESATVISLSLVGRLPVTRAHLGGVSYAAGSDPHRRIYSHNATPNPVKP